jgi:hypothetical protein
MRTMGFRRALELRAPLRRVAVALAGIALVGIGLIGCASVTRGAWTGAQVEQVASIERALEDGHVARARAEFDALERRTHQTSLALELERRIAALELEPFEPAFHEIALALEARDDELAGSILEFALARRPQGAALGVAERFKSVIEGRRLLRSLHLELQVSPIVGAARVRVGLAMRWEGDAPLELDTPGASLDYLCVGLTPNGVEQRSAQRVFVDVLDRLRLRPGEERRASMGEFPAPIQGLIAARGHWRLATTTGLAHVNGYELSSHDVPDTLGELAWLDPRLPRAAIEPAELVEYVRRGAPSMPALLERTVRVAPERRDEALDLLTPALLERPLVEIGRAGAVLRWLSGQRVDDGFGEDGPHWREWLLAREQRRREGSIDGAGDGPSPLHLPRRVSSDGAGDANVERR